MYQALIIDDERPVRTAISALGCWQKYRISELLYATNGEEGLSVMRDKNPQLVFVDMRMPVMNGSDFLGAAKKEFPNTQYIVVSGYDEFKYAQVAIKSGAIDYLLKPINGDDLNQAIEKAGTFGFDLHGAVMASDAFFPFPDCVEIAHKAGITAVIQPGGSIKDAESVAYCNANGLAMVTTGIRHFKH